MPEIKSVSLSDDATTVRVASDTGHIDFPASEINVLVMLLAQAEQQHKQKTASDPNLKNPYPVSWWNIGSAPDGSVVLSFQIPGGLEMSYRIDRTQATAIYETLSVGLGISKPSSPTQRH